MHCPSSMSRNTENWFEHNKATVPGVPRVDSQFNTTGDWEYPGNPPPDFHPQDSSCRTAEIRLAGACTCSMATALLQRFPCWTSKDCKIVYLHQTSQWEAWNHSGFAPFPSHQSRIMSRCQGGIDTQKHTQTKELLRVNKRQASTHTLCAMGQKDGGITAYLPVAAFEDLKTLKVWSPALTSPKAILQFC